MKFEVGRFYKHIGTGEMLHVVGGVITTIWGRGLVAEYIRGHEIGLMPLGMHEGATTNYVEIDKSEWDAQFSKE